MSSKKDKPKKDYVVGKNKPPKEHQIKKGQVLNPLGGRAHNPLTRALRELTAQTLSEGIKQVLTSPPSEIQKAIDSPETTVGLKIILRAALNASEDGAFYKLEEMLERVVGKVPQKLEVESPNGTMSPVAGAVVVLPSNGSESSN